MAMMQSSARVAQTPLSNLQALLRPLGETFDGFLARRLVSSDSMRTLLDRQRQEPRGEADLFW